METPKFEGQSSDGKWTMSINPKAGCYEVKGESDKRSFPQFSVSVVPLTDRLEVERNIFGTVRFATQSAAIAAAMMMTAPSDHKSNESCQCSQCRHFAN